MPKSDLTSEDLEFCRDLAREFFAGPSEVRLGIAELTHVFDSLRERCQVQGGELAYIQKLLTEFLRHVRAADPTAVLTEHSPDPRLAKPAIESDQGLLGTFPRNERPELIGTDSRATELDHDRIIKRMRG